MICSSAIGFDPTIDGQRLTFGFEGIWQGTAVLYDHQSRSLWMHITGECFEGTHAGRRLKPVDTGRHTTWGDWRRAHPQTDVLAEDPALLDPRTEHAYFPREGSRSGQAFFPPTFPPTIEDKDERLASHALVYGLVVGTQARAYPFERLARKTVVEETVGGEDITVWFDKASRSAAAYERGTGEQRFSFRFVEQGVLEDAETESRWSMEGLCIEGKLEGLTLRRVRGMMSEWYGWYASYPKTTIWR